MLIQQRERGLRLIRQHDHGLLSGAMAFAWRTGTGGGPAWRTALAAALHDVVWREEDLQPRLDPDTGTPHDFTTVPTRHKRDFVESGLAPLESLEPEVGSLVRAHHRSLAEGLRVDPTSELAWLRFFDNLSLFACLTPPGSLPEARPRWLSASALRPPRGSLAVAWRDEDTLGLSPFPFGASPLAVEVPFRELPRRRYVSAAELREAWGRAPEARWRLALAAGANPG